MTDNSEQWTIHLRLNGQQTNFCINTVAEVTVIPEKVYFCTSSPALKALDKTLKGAGNNRLDSRGQFLGCPQKGDLIIKEKIYVVKNLQKSPLGRPAIMGLNLVWRIDAIKKSSQSILEQFPSVFNGLDWIERNYTIKLQEEVKPFALTSPRRVPIPLLKPVKEETERMKKDESDISSTRTN